MNYIYLNKIMKNIEKIFMFYAALTLKRHLDKLIEKGLINETKMLVNKELISVYIFPYNKVSLNK